MTIQQRQALRAAKGIREALTYYQSCAKPPMLPEYSRELCQRLLRMIETARRRDWRLAMNRLELRLLQVVADYSSSLVRLRNDLTATRSWRYSVDEKAIAYDLLALPSEFSKVQIDLKMNLVAVDTQPIVLLGIDLGRFRVILDWQTLRQYHSYRVIALDPNPATSKPTVTHPHVKDDELCEGDGQSAICNALNHGRILDFFLLVRQILENYNSSTAYAVLESWQDEECDDCGSMVSDDRLVTCGCCEENICRDCTTNCLECGESFCAIHVDKCGHCGESFCRSCSAVCRQCRKRFCEECLDEQACPACREEFLDDLDEGEVEDRHESQSPVVESAPYAHATI